MRRFQTSVRKFCQISPTLSSFDARQSEKDQRNSKVIALSCPSREVPAPYSAINSRFVIFLMVTIDAI